MTQLYKTTPSEDYPEVKEQNSAREYLLSCLPSCMICDCLRQRRNDEFFSKGRDKLTTELDIVSLLRRLRFYDAAFKKLLY